MHLGIIGAGNVGGTLGRRLATLGHRITYGSRDPARTEARIRPGHPGTVAVAAVGALRGADAVLLATPWKAAVAAVQELDPPRGLVLVDCTNPIVGRLEGLDPGGRDSGGEAIQRAVPGACVVKAFNTCGYEVMADPVFADGRAAMPLCGDDAAARELVAGLAEALGFRALDLGPLRNARHLEPLALLWITRALVLGAGRRWAFSVVG